ncbi:hypothetical protein ACQ4PT_018192 [Festuca glaucescens]
MAIAVRHSVLPPASPSPLLLAPSPETLQSMALPPSSSSCQQGSTSTQLEDPRYMLQNPRCSDLDVSRRCRMFDNNTARLHGSLIHDIRESASSRFRISVMKQLWDFLRLRFSILITDPSLQMK